MANFNLPALDEIDDGLIPEGTFAAKFTDYELGNDGYGKACVKFMFKFGNNTEAAGKNTDIRFVGIKSQRLVDIVTAINGGEYDPTGDLDDYLGNAVNITMKHVTRESGKNAGKTYSNVSEVLPHKSTKPKVKAGVSNDDFNVDDDDDLDI